MSDGRIAWQRFLRGAAVTGALAMVGAGTVMATPAAAASQPASAVTATTEHDHAHTSGSAMKYYLAAGLLGRNEVRERGKKVNDPNGAAVAKFRISGTRLYYSVEWRKTGRPTAFHIHRGKAGTNGPVVIDLLSNGDIRGNVSFGSVHVKSSLLKDIRKNPKNWYANLHTAEFPDGAVRGQLRHGNHW
ncbi:CHRD domain-containing protein [Nonomuraea sp. NPDC003709]|uniref:CHRD domain-containing protein n=1 Tax=Nonomuraea sp. NPDC003709 TaxID=3154450 RepID=UPI0033B1E3CF